MKSVKIYVKDYCPYCTRAKALLNSKNIPFETVDIEKDQNFAEKLFAQTGFRTVPQIFIGDECIGGYTQLAELDQNGELTKKLEA